MSGIPRLPAEISNDGREVWEWAAKLSERVALVDDLKRTRQQVQNIDRRCGSCRMWMTRACPAEKHNNQIGRSQGPSGDARACSQFVIEPSYAKMKADGEQRIAALESQLRGGPA